MANAEEVIDEQTTTVRSVFKAHHVIKPFYNGAGRVALGPEGSGNGLGCIVCAAGGTLNMVEIKTGKIMKQIVLDGEEEEISCFAVRPVLTATGGIEVLIATKSLQLKHYRVETQVECVRRYV
jgi:hypothetical protein